MINRLEKKGEKDKYGNHYATEYPSHTVCGETGKGEISQQHNMKGVDSGRKGQL